MLSDITVICGTIVLLGLFTCVTYYTVCMGRERLHQEAITSRQRYRTRNSDGGTGEGGLLGALVPLLQDPAVRSLLEGFLKNPLSGSARGEAQQRSLDVKWADGSSDGGR